VSTPPLPLDTRVSELAEDPGRTWGLREAVLGILAVPVVFAVTIAVLSVVPEVPGPVATGLATAGLAVLTVLLGRRAARESGGWERALGFDLPEWSDTRRVLGWALLLFVAQSVVVISLVQLPALSGATADNSSFLRDEPLASLLAFAVLAAVVAPVLEELLFRGLVLRGLMLRIGFWPAALVSSACFGLFHAQSLSRDSVAVVAATSVFGVGLCVLTRRTGRLGPGLGVHALRNAVAILFAVNAPPV
jgi:membrane protease YdiL (CAAX protease family)